MILIDIIFCLGAQENPISYASEIGSVRIDSLCFQFETLDRTNRRAAKKFAL